MKEIPVLFNGAMVRAILDDRKTQTRRIVKPQPGADIVDIEYEPEADLWLGNTQEDNDLGYCSSWSARSPLGKPGDRLWVRETFISLPACAETGRRAHAIYHADGGYSDGYKWSPSIHMPRWAARLFLDVLDVRIERLQDISEEDARAEGFGSRAEFLAAWASIYGQESVDANHWVFVTTFRKVP